MGTRIIIISLLCFTLSNLYGQTSLTESIIKFRSNCSEPIIPEDTVAEFKLFELSTEESLITLSFEIIANCAQQKQGLVSIATDTLIILEKEVEKREKKIKDSQVVIDGIARRKEAVIKSYLMGEAEEPELAMAAEPETKYRKKKS